MDSRCRLRSVASISPKKTQGGGQHRAPNQGEQNPASIQNARTTTASAVSDALLAWPGDTYPFVKPTAATRALSVQHGAENRGSTAGSVAWDSVAVIHELKQPLSAIVSNAEASLRWLSLEAPNLPAARESAKRIIRDAKAAADLIDRLRCLFREAGPQRTNVDLNDVIFAILRRLSDRLEERAIITETSTTMGPACVYADRVLLEQVLHNLIANAIDAMHSTTLADRILVVYSSRETDGTVLVSVEDRGCGLDNVEQVFDPFFSTKEDGLGLGLWICRSIIKMHNGKLWAEKVRHGGTRFSFALPVHRTAPGQESCV